jgi:hypothetical protein
MRTFFQGRSYRSAALLVLAFVPALGLAAETSVSAVQQESEKRLKQDITFLASDECEGRGAATKGLDRAADYIANEFKKAGLKPGNTDGTYFQTFTLPCSIEEGTPHLVLKGPRGQEIVLKAGEHFHAMGLGKRGKVTNAPVVFAGYGVSSEALKYDDYEGLDVEGKVVIVLRDVPRPGDQALAGKLRPQAPLTTKMARADKKKAAAILYVNDAAMAHDGDDLVDFNYTAIGEESGTLPAMHLRRSVLEMMLSGSQAVALSDLEKDIDREFKPRSCELTGWTVSLEVKMRKDKVTLKNVIGVQEGNGPLAKETVVVGAHYDHLGYGGAGGSRATVRKMAIHHGADDNGSGSTVVLELARRFGAFPRRDGRRLVFMTFSGEELGLLGSKYYCKNPIYPLTDTVAMLNLDMVGRLKPDDKTKKDKLLIEAANTAKLFDTVLDTLNKKHDFEMVRSTEMLPNSDHFSFYQKEVPVLFFWTGLHTDYHRPSDTSDKINVRGMRRVAELSQDVLGQLTTTEPRPVWIKVKVAGGGGRGDGPRLGIMPGNYGEKGDGLLIDDVASGGPAAKAGLKSGDVIVEIAGKPVKNIQTYMTIMGTQKKGDTIDVTILRDSKKQTVKVKLD